MPLNDLSVFGFFSAPYLLEPPGLWPPLDRWLSQAVAQATGGFIHFSLGWSPCFLAPLFSLSVYSLILGGAYPQ